MIIFENISWKNFLSTGNQPTRLKLNDHNTNRIEFIDKLYSVGVADLKIVENFEFSGWYDKDTVTDVETEDTLSILNRYIEESEVSLDKSKIQKVIRDVYQEACELV